MTTLEYGEIQGLLLYGHSRLTYASYLFLEFTRQDGTRAWLRGLLEDITTAAPVPRDQRENKAIHLAFTASGLQHLGLGESALATFSDEFRWGMASRARVLGDTGASAPEHWEIGGPGQRIDALLLLYAVGDAEREALVQTLEAAMSEQGVRVVRGGREDTTPIGLTEHFGFRDGISQAAFQGGPREAASPQPPLYPGEFILGQVNEYGTNPLPPSVAAADDPGGTLEEREGRRLFGVNGTYLVFRKLTQDVAGFWQFVEAKAAALGGVAHAQTPEWLAAKMVGRWPNGDPLAAGMPRTDGTPQTGTPSNDFGYAEKDAAGLGCPVAAHVRRANPRDSLPPDAKRSLMTVARHRILRRGRSFGKPVDEAARSVDDGADRGLYFIALSADLRRQFEFVQQSWLDNPNFGGLQNDGDPLLGSRDARRDDDDSLVPADDFSFAAEPYRQRLSGLPRFVQNRGGGYFFVPGMRALRYLAQVGTPAPAAAAVEPSSAQVHALVSALLKEGRVLEPGLQNLGDMIVEHFQEWGSEPARLSPLFQFLREHDPIFIAPGVALVSHYDDVREAFANDAAFSVSEVYAEPMHATSGDFFLGMENGPTYQREAGIARGAVRPEDPEIIRALVARHTREILDAARAHGGIDLVAGITRPVAARTVRDFFGVPGPDEPTLMRWMRTIFWEIFLDPSKLPTVREAAKKSSDEMRTYLMALIPERRSAPRDDYLSRLIARADAAVPRLDDDGIRRNIGGIIAGAVDTTSKAAALAIAYLLDHPIEHARARRAAQSGNDALLYRYVLEALRFSPQTPLVLRYARQAVVLARGTARAKEIPKGSRVVLGTLSAAFDDTRVADPHRFRVDRASPDPELFHFGFGLHHCFGLFVNRIQLPEMVKQVLSEGGLRRVRGPEGMMRYEGPFPDRMGIAF
jgi:Dyp-type peroxidase family